MEALQGERLDGIYRADKWQRENKTRPVRLEGHLLIPQHQLPLHYCWLLAAGVLSVRRGGAGEACGAGHLPLS